VPATGTPFSFARNEGTVRTARGKADHLPLRGFLFGTREPQLERRGSEPRQAAKSSDVSSGGRSLRSSRSAGKPRAWRRGTVDACDFQAAGESHVCDISARQELALSPLLANVALSAIEERYERHVWPRRTPTLLTNSKAIGNRAMRARTLDRPRRPMCFPIRYADDFIILVSVPPGPLQSERAQEVALQEKAALTKSLWENLHLELSEAKTLVTPVTRPLRFLGHHVRVDVHPTRRWMASGVVIPTDRSQRIRELIKDLFRSSTVQSSLKQRLQLLNPLLRGWGNFYRHARGPKAVFSALDDYVWKTIRRWLMKKHRPAFMKDLRKRYAWRNPGGRGYGWSDGGMMPYRLSRLRVDHFCLGWMSTPDFV